jgi:hypothetical protein
VLDGDGRPVRCDDLTAWAFWMERSAYDRSRVIAEDRDEGDPAHIVRVSTVFLGLDYQFGNGPPVLWETMIFGGVRNGEQRRYTSRAAALIGHQEMCERVSATIHRPTPAAD